MKIEKSIDVKAPLRAVYNQWTQFEEFPRFMEGVKEVQQVDDTHLHWCATVAGKEVEWDAEITEQVPDQRIAWRATEGTHNAGVVTFHRLEDDVSRVALQLDIEPEGLVETIADKMGFIRRRAEADLERFKAMIEERGVETGAWRGTVDGPG